MRHLSHLQNCLTSHLRVFVTRWKTKRLDISNCTNCSFSCSKPQQVDIISFLCFQLWLFSFLLVLLLALPSLWVSLCLLLPARSLRKPLLWDLAFLLHLVPICSLLFHSLKLFELLFVVFQTREALLSMSACFNNQMFFIIIFLRFYA